MYKQTYKKRTYNFPSYIPHKFTEDEFKECFSDSMLDKVNVEVVEKKAFAISGPTKIIRSLMFIAECSESGSRTEYNFVMEKTQYKNNIEISRIILKPKHNTFESLAQELYNHCRYKYPASKIHEDLKHQFAIDDGHSYSMDEMRTNENNVPIDITVPINDLHNSSNSMSITNSSSVIAATVDTTESYNISENIVAQEKEAPFESVSNDYDQDIAYMIHEYDDISDYDINSDENENAYYFIPNHNPVSDHQSIQEVLFDQVSELNEALPSSSVVSSTESPVEHQFLDKSSGDSLTNSHSNLAYHLMKESDGDEFIPLRSDPPVEVKASHHDVHFSPSSALEMTTKSSHPMEPVCKKLKTSENNVSTERLETTSRLPVRLIEGESFFQQWSKDRTKLILYLVRNPGCVYEEVKCTTIEGKFYAEVRFTLAFSDDVVQVAESGAVVNHSTKDVHRLLIQLQQNSKCDINKEDDTILAFIFTPNNVYGPIS